MKYTLLEMVQFILSSMDSDEVSDIDETVESTQVVKVIKFVYENMVADLNLPEHFGLFELVASGDNTQPTIMTLPSNIIELRSVRYNNQLSTETNPDFVKVNWMDWEEFFDFINSFDASESNVSSFTRTIDGDDITLKYTNDAFPQWYSSFDDNTLVFDSYLATETTTLTSANSQCHGQLAPVFTLSNTFTPDLDHKQFPLLLNDSKALAHAEIKQTTHNKAERMARNNKISTQRHKTQISQPTPDFQRLPDYGRK